MQLLSCDGTDEKECPNTCEVDDARKAAMKNRSKRARAQGLAKLASLAVRGSSIRASLKETEADDMAKLKKTVQALRAIKAELQQQGENPSPQLQQQWHKAKAQADNLQQSIGRSRKLLELRSDHVLGLAKDCPNSG